MEGYQHRPAAFSVESVATNRYLVGECLQPRALVDALLQSGEAGVQHAGGGTVDKAVQPLVEEDCASSLLSPGAEQQRQHSRLCRALHLAAHQQPCLLGVANRDPAT